MHILQLCNKFIYPPKDGGAIGIYNYTKAFSALGHDVTVLAMNTSKHSFDIKNLPDHVKKIARWETADVDNRIKPFAALIALMSGESYHIKRFISSAFNDKLIELLHQNKFDVIQLEGLYLSPYLETIRAFSDATISMRSHNVEHEIWQRIAENEKGFLKRSYLKILAKQLRKYEISRLNKYDVLTSVTDRDASILKELGCELPIHVCPAPYDETILVPVKTGTEIPSLFFIGALDWKPNLEGLQWFLNKAWPAIHQKYPQLKFYIAGRNADQAAIASSENVIVAGEVDDAYAFMNSKHIMIVPLLSGSGIRIKIIEGMALNKAIISTTIGAEGIPCKDGQNILLADSPEKFLEQISKCLDSTMTASVIGDNAYQFARLRYSSKEVTGKLIEFFEQHKPAGS